MTIISIRSLRLSYLISRKRWTCSTVLAMVKSTSASVVKRPIPNLMHRERSDLLVRKTLFHLLPNRWMSEIFFCPDGTKNVRGFEWCRSTSTNRWTMARGYRREKEILTFPMRGQYLSKPSVMTLLRRKRRRDWHNRSSVLRDHHWEWYACIGWWPHRSIAVPIDWYVSHRTKQSYRSSLVLLRTLLLTYRHFFLGDLTRGTEPDDQRRGNSSTANVSFLSTSCLDGIQANTRSPTHVECSDTFGSVNLVTADGHQIDVHLIDIDGYFAHCLSSIGVKEDLLRSTQLP